MKRTFLLTILLAVTCQWIAAQEPEPAWQWFKGNTHTHTTESDGDSSPTYVAKWYKDHGYDFLVLSDHNVLTNPRMAGEVMDDGFLLIPGEEVSAGHNKKPVHLNGLNIRELVKPISNQEDISVTIQANIDAIRSAGGVPHINHPNFHWAFAHTELMKVNDYRLLEIYNGHPMVNNLGGSGHAGMEEVWDVLLSSGNRIYGIAVDDAHHFQGEFGPHRSNPGKGWLVVRAPELTAGAIMKALENGDFYASTGVVLENIVVGEDNLIVLIKQVRDFGYRTEFIGWGGGVLKETEENPAIYDYDGTEQYVRAKVYDSNGAVAWIQPVFPILQEEQ